MRVIPILLLATLAGCGAPTAPTNDAASANDTAVTAPAGPAFAATSDQVARAVDGLGAPWSGGQQKDGMRDAKTGGTVRTITTADGSAQIFAWPNGAVWQVRLIDGGAGGCGDIARVRAALPKLAAELKVAATPAELLRISDGLNDPGTHDTALKGAKVSAVGGCRMWLTMTAA